MILNMYSIFDRLSNEYWPINCDRNDQTVKRMYQNIMESDPRSLLATHCSDFALYRLGDFDTETGKINLYEPICVCYIESLKKE